MRDQSWGGFPRVENQKTIFYDGKSPLPSNGSSLLPRGLGRSYGDSCLNDNNTLLNTRYLDHFISFDSSSGVLTAQAGVSLERILEVFVPRGWFLPVTPGTKFVTLGGALANDVHGKNHHIDGSFSHFVERFELLRSDGSKHICSRTENSDLFRATIGGLGLTGLITWAEIRLIPIQSSLIDQEQIKFSSFNEFLSLSKESQNHKYTVSWVDCLGSEKSLRGIFIRGNHSEKQTSLTPHRSEQKVNIPFYFPDIALNKVTASAFNHLYYAKNLRKVSASKVHYDSFFYPLDAVLHWNNVYGKRGFLQYQFVVPFESGNSPGIHSIFSEIKKSGLGSFLAVLKTFGSKNNEGMMSFPKEGITLALDFPNTGEKLFSLLNRCDEIVKDLGGRLYPAKDARMSKASFQEFYPNLNEFIKYIDPKISSTFWRRVT